MPTFREEDFDEQGTSNWPVFTARRYASAVLAVIVLVRLFVCLSFHHKSELYKNG